MNVSDPPVLPAAPPPRIPPIVRPPAMFPGEKLLPTCLGVAVLVILGDFLFWNHRPGLSLAVFVFAVAAVMVARNWTEARTSRVAIAFSLLVVSAWQTAVEISFTNLVVEAALLAVLMAELRFRELPAGWGRWSESLIAWICALGRWSWLVRAINERPRTKVGGRSVGETIGRVLAMTLPAIILLFVFISLFASGNSIFHQFFNHSINHFYDWCAGIDLDFGRTVFWFCLATLGLAFLRPREGAKTPRAWARPLAGWQRADSSMAYWQSALILIALNVLFFAINTIDVVYLWQRAAPPVGVLARDYLYSGVYSLIAATALAGIVLTFLFQQPAQVISRRGLQGFAFAWILQNFVLIAGVFLRLKMFVDLSDVTEKRVYVACFLLLVAVGFALLCAHVLHGRMAGRLIWRNVVTTFVLFFVLQFLNVSGWVVRQNFSRRDRGSQGLAVNVPYNMSLGADSWPSLIEIAEHLPAGTVRDELTLDLRERARLERGSRTASRDWREIQWRHDQNAAALVSWAAPFGELSEQELASPAIEQMRSAERGLRSMD